MTFDDNTKNILLIESSKPSFIKDVNSREFEEKITNIAKKITIDAGIYNVCLKDIHLDNVRIFGQGVQKFVQLNLYTAL